MFTAYTRGDDFCPKCGEQVRWVRLANARWLAVQTVPVLYIEGEGHRWLVSKAYNGVLLKNCQIYEPNKGMDIAKVKKGYLPHIFCCGR